MTPFNSSLDSVSTSPFKRTHSWPPSQWYLDRISLSPDPASPLEPASEPDQLQAPCNTPQSAFVNLAEESKLADDAETEDSSETELVEPASIRSVSTGATLKHRTSLLLRRIHGLSSISLNEPKKSEDDTEAGDESESESVKAASIKTVYSPSANSSRIDLLSHKSSRSSRSGDGQANARRRAFTERHLKRFAREMSRTSRKMRRALHFSRHNKESSKSPDNHSDIRHDSRRSRKRAQVIIHNPPHEMSYGDDELMLVAPVPVPPKTFERRSSIVPGDPLQTDETDRIPRRDLLDLNGGIKASSGMPLIIRKRHASGKRRASREPERTLQDIKEEWNASQVSRDAWAARVNAWPPGSPRSRALTA